MNFKAIKNRRQETNTFYPDLNQKVYIKHVNSSKTFLFKLLLIKKEQSKEDWEVKVREKWSFWIDKYEERLKLDVNNKRASVEALNEIKNKVYVCNINIF